MSKHPSSPSRQRGKAPPGDLPAAPALDGTQAPAAEMAAAAPAETLRALNETLADEFPMPVDATELVLMDVDPRRLHAFWSVTGGDLEREIGQAPSATPELVLRLFDVTPPEGSGVEQLPPFEVEVQGTQGHTYIDLWSDGRSYVADLGLRAPDGELRWIARSNTVQMPRSGPSPLQTLRLVDVSGPPDAAAQAEPAAPAESPQRGAAAAVTALAPRPEAPSVAAPAPPVQAPGPSADSPAPPPPAPAPAAPDQSPVAQAGTGPERQAPELDPTLYAGADFDLLPSFPDAAADTPPAAHPPAAPDALASLGIDGGPWPAPLAVEPVYLPPAVLQAMGPEGMDTPAAQAPGTPAWEPIVTYSSHQAGGAGGPGVDLEVYAELHVYGRTRRGGRLFLFGRQVPLRPDGSFSVRRPLPSGAVVVPVLLGEDDTPDAGA